MALTRKTDEDSDNSKGLETLRKDKHKMKEEDYNFIQEEIYEYFTLETAGQESLRTVSMPFASNTGSFWSSVSYM